MSDTTILFEDDCYGSILTVKPVGDPLDDWLFIEGTHDGEQVSSNAMPPEQIEALRDALTAWLEEHPVKPDPFDNGGEVEWDIDGETFYVSRVGGVTA